MIQQESGSHYKTQQDLLFKLVCCRTAPPTWMKLEHLWHTAIALSTAAETIINALEEGVCVYMHIYMQPEWIKIDDFLKKNLKNDFFKI